MDSGSSGRGIKYRAGRVCDIDDVDAGSTEEAETVDQRSTKEIEIVDVGSIDDLERGLALDRNRAKKLIQEILSKKQKVVVVGHAKTELKNDNMTIVDATNVLRCGRIQEDAELENQCWRYRVRTKMMVVVVQFFPDGSGLKVITAWRLK